MAAVDKAAAKKAPPKTVSHALAFSEDTDDGVAIRENISFVGPAKAVAREMKRVLEQHGES